MKIKIKFVIVALCLSLSLQAGAIQNIKIEQNSDLGLNDCIKIALNNSPVIKKYIFEEVDPYVQKLVKAADRICAYIKCIEEKKSGNVEFDKAAKRVYESILKMNLNEVDYFIEHFLPSFEMTLDELN